MWHRKKKGHHKIPQSENRDNIAERIPADQLEETEAQGAINYTMEASALPKWLTDNPEMIFPQECIEKGPQLGEGLYGIVFKGKLVVGKCM